MNLSKSNREKMEQRREELAKILHTTVDEELLFECERCSDVEVAIMAIKRICALHPERAEEITFEFFWKHTEEIFDPEFVEEAEKFGLESLARFPEQKMLEAITVSLPGILEQAVDMFDRIYAD